jgi:hypothetical protein
VEDAHHARLADARGHLKAGGAKSFGGDTRGSRLRIESSGCAWMSVYTRSRSGS